MKRNALLTVLLPVAILLAVLLIFAAKTGYSRVLEANWGISLPFRSLYTEIYENDASGFHGDGLRYHVYRYKYEDYIDLMFAWRSRENETIFHSSYSEAAETWLDELQVPAEERPDYAACAYWYKAQEDHSELIVFWDQERNRLYILESFL